MFGWCSWLSRAPHTREVPSSILGSNNFLYDFLLSEGSPCGLMDKALPSGGRDCGFESRLGLVLLRHRKKVPEAGFEPAAFSLGGRRAIHCATRTDTKYSCSGGVVGYHASLTHWRSRVRSSPRILFFFFSLQQAGLAQLVERWSHNPKVVSSILTPGTFCVDELWGFRAWTSNPWGINVPVVRFHLPREFFFFGSEKKKIKNICYWLHT